jgi:hypothetical protein
MPTCTERRRPRADPGAFNCSGRGVPSSEDFMPLLMRRVATRGGVNRLMCWRRIFHWSIPSLHRRRGKGRIGGDVVSYVEYAIVALYGDAEKKNLSCLLQAFRRPSHWALGGMKKCEGTSAFSEENPRDRRKKPAGETGKARAQRNHGVEVCFHSGILSRRALENDDCRKGCQIHGREESFLELAIHS